MENVRSIRESRGWSRAELARRAGLNASTVGQIEVGRLQPYPGQLSKIAAAFEVSVSELQGFSVADGA